jgi:hypothetical protein
VLLDPEGECIEVDRVATLGESARIAAIDFDGRFATQAQEVRR